jgi:hypothetical protein
MWLPPTLYVATTRIVCGYPSGPHPRALIPPEQQRSCGGSSAPRLRRRRGGAAIPLM